MDAAIKTKISNIITALVAILAVVQTSLTTDVFTLQQIAISGAIITFISVGLTALKQYWSAEVNSTGTKVSLYVLAATVLAGLLDLFKVFDLSTAVEHRIAWIITMLIAVVNILSKQIFPSEYQKGNIQTLKAVDTTNSIK